MQPLKARSIWLPIILTLIALVFFNAGLYFRLSPTTITSTRVLTLLPVKQTFDDSALDSWRSLGGNWAVRDSSLVQTSITGSDLGIVLPLDLKPEQNYQFRASLSFLAGTMGGGLLFNLQQTTTR